MFRIRVLLLTMLIVTLPGWAFALPTSVDVLPPIPSEGDVISLETTLSWSTSGFWVTGSSASLPSAFEVVVDVFVSSPAPGEIVVLVLTDEDHITNLGLLPAGIYSYSVNEISVQRDTGIQWLAGSLSGTFAVVPEPSSLALVVLGLSGLAVHRRRRRA